MRSHDEHRTVNHTAKDRHTTATRTRGARRGHARMALPRQAATRVVLPTRQGTLHLRIRLDIKGRVVRPTCTSSPRGWLRRDRRRVPDDRGHSTKRQRGGPMAAPTHRHKAQVARQVEPAQVRRPSRSRPHWRRGDTSHHGCSRTRRVNLALRKGSEVRNRPKRRLPSRA